MKRQKYAINSQEKENITFFIPPLENFSEQHGMQNEIKYIQSANHFKEYQDGQSCEYHSSAPIPVQSQP